ncbi:MAG TPA: DUF4328 domain-containing protein [Minicystis sp.]|nr:DUF4328 domain-containing protein [Minicystis sp.]
MDDITPGAAVRVTRGRAQIAVVGVLAVCAVRAAELLALGAQAAMLEHVRGGGVVSPADAALNDARIQTITSIAGVAWILAGVVFLRWVASAHRSANVLDRDDVGPTPPASAVWSYFIPFVNFVRPYHDMARLAQKSDPRDLVLPPERVENVGAGYRDAARREVARAPWSPPRYFVGLWWASYVLLTLWANAAAFVRPHRGTDLGSLLDGTYFMMAHDALLVVTGGLCVAVVRGITACQRERTRRLAILARAEAA